MQKTVQFLPHEIQEKRKILERILAHSQDGGQDLMSTGSSEGNQKEGDKRLPSSSGVMHLLLNEYRRQKCQTVQVVQFTLTLLECIESLEDQNIEIVSQINNLLPLKDENIFLAEEIRCLEKRVFELNELNGRLSKSLAQNTEALVDKNAKLGAIKALFYEHPLFEKLNQEKDLQFYRSVVDSVVKMFEDYKKLKLSFELKTQEARRVHKELLLRQTEIDLLKIITNQAQEQNQSLLSSINFTDSNPFWFEKKTYNLCLCRAGEETYNPSHKGFCLAEQIDELELSYKQSMHLFDKANAVELRQNINIIEVDSQNELEETELKNEKQAQKQTQPIPQEQSQSLATSNLSTETHMQFHIQSNEGQYGTDLTQAASSRQSQRGRPFFNPFGKRKWQGKKKKTWQRSLLFYQEKIAQGLEIFKEGIAL